MLQPLLSKIHGYLLGQLTLLDLELWLAAHLQHILNSGEPTAIYLADEIDADLIELGEDIITEEEMQRHLATLFMLYSQAPTFFLKTGEAGAGVTFQSGTGSRTIRAVATLVA